jgi:hypothetical protein
MARDDATSAPGTVVQENVRWQDVREAVLLGNFFAFPTD